MWSEPSRVTWVRAPEYSSGLASPDTPPNFYCSLVCSFPTASPAVCPTGGQISSHANATWGPRCFFVPPERSPSLFRCVDLCKEQGGIPACIGSAEENVKAMEITMNLPTSTALAAVGIHPVWLGLYQNETGLGPAKGWDRCVAGDASNFPTGMRASRTTLQTTKRTARLSTPGPAVA